VQPGRAEQLSEAMATLLKDGNLRRAMGAAAATRAREKFDVSAMIRAYEELYNEIATPSQTWNQFDLGHKSPATRENLGA